MKDTPDPPATDRPSIRLDIDDWMPHLESKDIPEADKIELIENLWNIAKAFVDFGWDLDTSAETSGQSYDLTAALRAAVLYSHEQDNKYEEKA